METAASLTRFPDWLSPVFVRDLRQGLRAPYLVWAFLLLHLFTLGATLTELGLFQAAGGQVLGSIVSGYFYAILMAGFVFFLPLTQFAALRSEVGRGRNVELLLTANLTRWQIVAGKFWMAESLAFLLLVSLLPYLLLRYFLGQVELPALAILVGSVILSNAVMNAFVIGASACRSAVARVVLIGFLGTAYLMVSAMGALGATLRSSAGGVPPAWEVALLAIHGFGVSFVMIPLGLQVGRTRLASRATAAETSAFTMLIILAFLLPIIFLAISTVLGGIGLVAGLAISGVVILYFDQDPMASTVGKIPGRRRDEIVPRRSRHPANIAP